jgi:hypothetical protein
MTSADRRSISLFVPKVDIACRVLAITALVLGLLAGGLGMMTAQAATTRAPGAHASIPPDGAGVSAQAVSGPNVAPGYWEVDSAGDVSAFGTQNLGDLAGTTLEKPIVGMAPTPDGKGYWLVASDGGLFAFGDAAFYGSTGNITLNKPIVGMASTPDGKGYWLVASDGGIFTYGDATFLGSAGGSTGPSTVAIAATSDASPYLSSSLGYDVSWPQCSTSDPEEASTLPTPSAAVNIVGVNDGYSPQGALSNGAAAFNACFSAEASWAGPALSAYINMDNLTNPSSVQAAKTIGAQDVEADYQFVTTQEGFHPQIWWLDVEGPNGDLWQGASNSSGQPYALNDAVIQGAITELHALGLTAGVYSTYVQWPEIVGTGVTIPQIPIWIAGAADQEQLVDYCTDPTKTFADGTPYLVQWAGDYGPYANQTPWNEDYACTP